MDLEQRFRAGLLAASGLSAVSIMEGPLTTRRGAEFKAITYTRISTSYNYTHDGRAPIHWARISCNCWAHTNSEARALAKLLIEAIDTFDLTKPDESPAVVYTVSPNKVLMQLSVPEPDAEPEVFRQVVDCQIWYVD